MIVEPAVWRETRVLVTGHTGFKGAWLSLWLSKLGARVFGLSLDPPTQPSLFDIADLGGVLEADRRGDIRSAATLMEVMAASEPKIVFHLAAQPIVREGYYDPIGTFATNIMGTAHLLEAVRATPSVEAVVLVTTDKVYENREWLHPYRENDALGGYDPYSASKAACEIVAASMRRSYFSDNTSAARIATARAGNVIGGGDFAAHRLVPDCIRAFLQGERVALRYPAAVRPWQHVLEPLAGYLAVAQRLLRSDGVRFANAWNFGPDTGGEASVGFVADRLARLWGGSARVELDSSNHPHEAGILRLDSTLSRLAFGWHPRLELETALAWTVDWHRALTSGEDMRRFTITQIDRYCRGEA